MKWFKHDTDSDDSEGISFLVAQEGFAGKGRWFTLLEIVASKMDKTDRCHVEYPTKKWCSLLGLKQKKLKTFLELTQNKLKTKVVYSENIIRIEIPNLLNKRDDYSRKSEHDPEKVTPRSKIEEIRLKSKEVSKDTPPAAPAVPEKKARVKKDKAPFTGLPEDFKISDRVKKWAQENKHENLDQHFESFVLSARSRSYQYADWDAAFMKAVRDNWAKLPTTVSHSKELRKQPNDAMAMLDRCKEWEKGNAN